MVKFKCLISGNIVSFTNEVDIVSTDSHPGYVRVEEAPQAEAKTPTVKKTVKAQPSNHSSEDK